MPLMPVNQEQKYIRMANCTCPNVKGQRGSMPHIIIMDVTGE